MNGVNKAPSIVCKENFFMFFDKEKLHVFLLKFFVCFVYMYVCVCKVGIFEYVPMYYLCTEPIFYSTKVYLMHNFCY